MPYHITSSPLLPKGLYNEAVALTTSGQIPGTAKGHAHSQQMEIRRTYQAIPPKRLSDFCSEFHISTPASYPLPNVSYASTYHTSAHHFRSLPGHN